MSLTKKAYKTRTRDGTSYILRHERGQMHGGSNISGEIWILFPFHTMHKMQQQGDKYVNKSKYNSEIFVAGDLSYIFKQKCNDVCRGSNTLMSLH